MGHFSLAPKAMSFDRVPGVSRLDSMITLCTGCDAIVERTQIVLGEMTPPLLVLGVKSIPKSRSSLLAFGFGIARRDRAIVNSGLD